SKVKLDDIVSIEHYNNSSCKKLPNLRDFFFSKFQICFEEDISAIIKGNAFWISQGSSDSNYQWKSLWEDHGFIPIAYHVRDTIRRIESVKSNKSDRHRIFGYVGNGCTKGSQIFVSHGYKIDDRT